MSMNYNYNSPNKYRNNNYMSNNNNIDDIRGYRQQQPINNSNTNARADILQRANQRI